MLYLNTIELFFLFVEQLDQLELCLPYCRLLTGILILAVFQNLRWNSNKTSLYAVHFVVSFRGEQHPNLHALVELPSVDATIFMQNAVI